MNRERALAAPAVRLAAVLSLIIGLAGCTGGVRSSGDVFEMTDTLFEISDFADAYAAAFVSGDADEVGGLLTDDFVALTPGKPPVVGRDAALEAIRADLAAMDVIELTFVPRDITIINDTAWTWGESSATIERRADGTRDSIQGKYLWILQRGQGGQWRIARDSAHGE